jgi:hypothetical protein
MFQFVLKEVLLSRHVISRVYKIIFIQHICHMPDLRVTLNSLRFLRNFGHFACFCSRKSQYIFLNNK